MARHVKNLSSIPSTPPPAARGNLDHVRRALVDQQLIDRLARTFKALGDPTRSRMVLALALEEMCVSDLAEALGASLSATSHQLRILRDLDIVRVRRAGRSQLYKLNERAFGFCSPRVCQAWKQSAGREGIPRSSGRATGRSGGHATVRSGGREAPTRNRS